jgi:hypothetical protein
MSPNAAGTALKNSILAGLAVVIVHFIFKNLSIDRDAHLAHRHASMADLGWGGYASRGYSDSSSSSDSDSEDSARHDATSKPPALAMAGEPDILQYVFASEGAAPAAPQAARRARAAAATECLSVEAFDRGAGRMFGASLLDDDANDAKDSLDALFAPLK